MKTNVKIKTGRFDGQPDWMPDCKMARSKKSGKEYCWFTINSLGVAFGLDGGVFESGRCYGTIFEDLDFIYEPDPQPLDVVACWSSRRFFVYTITYKDIDFRYWDHAVIVPEELKNMTDYSVETWQKLKDEGKVEVIK